MKIRLRTRGSSQGARWVLLTLYYSMFSYVLVYTLGLPRSLLYIGDILTIWSFVLAFYKKSKRNFLIPSEFLLLVVFMLLGVFNAFVNSEPILLVVWGLRNILRYFLFLYSCYVLLEIQDIENVLKFLWKIFWLSIPLCTIERFFVHYPAGTIIGDMVGGVFWNYSGCNLPLNIILCICIIDSARGFFADNIKLPRFVITCVMAMYMAATAELKVFFVEFAVIIIVSAIVARAKWNKVLVMFIGALFFSQAISLFVTLNASTSYDYSAIFSVNGLIEYATRQSGYNGTGDVNRLTGIATIWKQLFEGNLEKCLFGIGLGNAEYTNFFASDFYRKYGYMNYQWFHMIWMFIENGLIGILIYISFFIKTLKKSFAIRKEDEYASIAAISIVIMLLLYIYNNSLRVEASGYLMFMILSVPYICLRDRKRRYEK
ncbi:3-phosphoshikimate 1-carboxyvinyltransferase [Streptococcus thermophilus]|uniref:3-phosphoshikimate 1-carboxyvinyltransferase n=1 Tax=Streptococcus thermophilus TaxID=1308 RepID=UPI0015C25D76|nr:3-phosphoshikimate 1-carboxyvinyltransferase [Streptococcus thermophilus]MCT2912537.1 3-phosphoshikimate 1-carboxyvinyltransferase [Streptococcus thermophilus]MCT2916466.1 3-phosphoshikimate 1-carboxyvinyltransferase [Streptococcus thermophilus]CAD0163188.1 Wzy [Streptococcus thermophilus]CAD0163990.1 Wzy [Streptococcus thermophilus]